MLVDWICKRNVLLAAITCTNPKTTDTHKRPTLFTLPSRLVKRESQAWVYISQPCTLPISRTDNFSSNGSGRHSLPMTTNPSQVSNSQPSAQTSCPRYTNLDPIKKRKRKKKQVLQYNMDHCLYDTCNTLCFCSIPQFISYFLKCVLMHLITNVIKGQWLRKNIDTKNIQTYGQAKNNIPMNRIVR